MQTKTKTRETFEQARERAQAVANRTQQRVHLYRSTPADGGGIHVSHVMPHASATCEAIVPEMDPHD
jgi:hypothetical protein